VSGFKSGRRRPVIATSLSGSGSLQGEVQLTSAETHRPSSDEVVTASVAPDANFQGKFTLQISSNIHIVQDLHSDQRLNLQEV
jgi:hypothetical protein